MNAKVHKNIMQLAIAMGITTMAEYAKFALKIKQIAKEVKQC